MDRRELEGDFFDEFHDCDVDWDVEDVDESGLENGNESDGDADVLLIADDNAAAGINPAPLPAMQDVVKGRQSLFPR